MTSPADELAAAALSDFLTLRDEEFERAAKRVSDHRLWTGSVHRTKQKVLFHKATMKSMLFLLRLAVVTLTTSAVAAAQAPIPRDEALSYTAYYWDGPGSISEEVRRRVLADSAAIELYAQLINGTVAWPPGSDTATVLFWLGESRQRRFIPVFMRYARLVPTNRKPNIFVASVAGLARHADVTEAANRLRELMLNPVERDAAFLVASVLATVNDLPARRVLAGLPESALSAPVRDLVRQTLASPALERGRSAYPATPRRAP